MREEEDDHEGDGEDAEEGEADEGFVFGADACSFEEDPCDGEGNGQPNRIFDEVCDDHEIVDAPMDDAVGIGCCP